MTKSMKAIVYHAPKDIKLETLDVPRCDEDQIRVKVDACAVCGTDLKSYLHGNPRIRAPQVIGHEFTGIVDTVGANTKDFTLGDRIVMATSISCGECFYCKNGLSNLCINLAPMGFAYPGGMAEFVTIPQTALTNGHVIKVPSTVKAEHAALAEPLSCAVNCAENCNIKTGDTVVIIGAGPMGIMNACVARNYGAEKIIISEVNPTRLKSAESFNFDILIDPAGGDLTQAVKDATNGVGADVVIAAAPAVEPQEKALTLVRKHGTVCLFASLPADRSTISIDSRTIHYGEIRLIGTSDSRPEHVAKAVDIIAAKTISVDKLASHIIDMENIFEAFDLMQAGNAMRVVLTP
jgi:L-iditol 2-dehydrogenase